MWSATWPKEVGELAKDYLSDPIQVNVGIQGDLSANENITQVIDVVEPLEKKAK